MSGFVILSKLADHTSGIIHDFSNDQLASKLLAMGMLPGKTVTLVRRVPFGGGFYVKIDNQTFALRDEEAQHIILHINQNAEEDTPEDAPEYVES